MKKILTTILLFCSLILSANENDTIPAHWKPDPYRAVWMAAILPGAGQIYNRSYWKLPIVYGGLMGCAYAIVLNQTSFDTYKTAYRDILTDEVLSTDPKRSYNAILPKGYDIERMGGRDRYTQTLENQQNTFRRYRDISIVATLLVYGLSIIDAYVDAQLFDFDMSPDLSMNIEPDLYYDALRQTRTPEVHVAIKF
ncbi:MAG: DUF5683 domain-containing protein [Paludibacteraceae bacterium]|nr:DUF5683 domain-containing protein [Paludibacteraceae bacterium]